MNKKEINMLNLNAYKIRRHILDGVYNAASGHPGGSLSIAEIMSVLYFKEMNVDVNNPKNPDRDRFVLSKGHCAPALYGALAEKGFIPKEDIVTLRKTDSYLEGHPDMKGIPGVDMSSGSLGQGISCANGMALAGKLKNKDYRVYAVLGDGEIEEGQVWEAAMFAAHYKLDNATYFLDLNGLQIDGPTSEVMSSAPADKKFETFGFNVLTIDAHNVEEIYDAIQKAKECKGKPTMIICKSTKGKGVSYMENKCEWHGAAPKQDLYEVAIKEIDAKIAELEVLCNE